MPMRLSFRAITTKSNIYFFGFSVNLLPQAVARDRALTLGAVAVRDCACGTLIRHPLQAGKTVSTSYDSLILFIFTQTQRVHVRG